jgi:hypothetical protein
MADASSNELRVAGFEGIQIGIGRIEMNEGREEISGDDMGKGGGVFVFF